ncbi:hypothetical protein P9869_38150 [Streptomyces ossamyceticus]|nr:hypothetical protein [Streptomyces ossamyceticus]
MTKLLGLTVKSGAPVGAIVSLLLVTSCVGDTTPDPDLVANKACGGISPAAASSLQEITETDEFEYRWDSSVARLLKKALKEPGQEEWNELLACEIFPQQPEGSEGVSKISILFEELSALPPSEDDLLGQVTYPIALRATANDGNAQIYFSCDLTGNSSAGENRSVVYGELVYRPRDRKEDPRPGNVKVLQDISSKIAKSMGCERGGDIPKV